tara:strand:+ start:1517 stop:2302 length:786 start_codon:yes stop_codon:yes gene_type:complete
MTQNLVNPQLELPMVMGRLFEELPEDLFIPPNALEICLEKFSGPMDLLLYLIKKENLNILELDVSKITDQYIEYINLMDVLKFELAAEYLVMAATLAEIKSRLLLPKEIYEDEDEDPKLSLMKRLQEYQRFKIASEKIAILPRIDRDFFIASAKIPELKIEKKKAEITKDDLFLAYQEILARPKLTKNHLIDFEELSTQERIEIILKILSGKKIISFSKALRKKEGKQGVVVTLLASLELAKDGHIELIQNKTNEIYLKAI